MARRPKGDDAATRPSLRPAAGLSLVTTQIGKGQDLLAGRPIEAAACLAWRNTSREVLIRCFGSDSGNVEAFDQAGAPLPFGLYATPDDRQQERRKGVQVQVKLLGSCKEQLQMLAHEEADQRREPDPAGSGGEWISEKVVEVDETGLTVKKWFARDLEFAAAGASVAQPLALLTFDIDHFKRVNDTHGHPIGDEVLREVARLLREAGVHRGKAFRIGGEELALVLRNCSADEGRALAQRVLDRVRGLVFSVQDLRITISAGVAVFPSKSAESTEGLVTAADSALYRAKHEGRDRVRTAGESESAAPNPGARSQALPGLDGRGGAPRDGLVPAFAELTPPDRRVLLMGGISWAGRAAQIELDAVAAALGWSVAEVVETLRDLEAADKLVIDELGRFVATVYRPLGGRLVRG